MSKQFLNHEVHKPPKYHYGHRMLDLVPRPRLVNRFINVLFSFRLVE